MSIAWITTKFDSELIKTFRTARWEIKSFTPRDFIPCYQFNGSDFEIMIIEAMDRSSLSICEEICHQQIAPVLAIVADLAYAQAVIEAGAEDFLVAPVKPIDALLRVRKLVQGASIVRVGDLEVDLPTWNVSHRGHRLRLSTVEFRLLASLAKRVGQIVRVRSMESLGSPDRC